MSGLILYGERNFTIEELRGFWDNVVMNFTHLEKRHRDDKDYCLIYDRSLNPYPQATLRLGNDQAIMRLHRVALTLKLGRYIRQDNVASHLCHRKDCINPDHLIEESQTENLKRPRVHK